jgi:hypothetical protein
MWDDDLRQSIEMKGRASRKGSIGVMLEFGRGLAR